MSVRTDTTKLCADCGVKYRVHKTCCRECSRARSHAYEKTPKGYLMRTYRNMTSRVNGTLKNKAHLYKGLPICDKKDFYKWSLGTESSFLTLLKEYEESGYDFTMAPSVDRVVVGDGYVLGNIRWVSHGLNSSKTFKNKDLELPVGIVKKRDNTFLVKKTFSGEIHTKDCIHYQEAVDYLENLYKTYNRTETKAYLEFTKQTRSTNERF